MTLIMWNLNLISVQTRTYVSYLFDSDSISSNHAVFWSDILLFYEC